MPPDIRGRLELMAVFLGVGADWRSTRWVPFAPRVVTEVPAVDGGIWVIREMAGERIEACDESPEDFFAFDAAPCWRQAFIGDVFDSAGSFVRSARMPGDIRYHVRPHIDGNQLLALTEDEAGVARVRGYRPLAAR